VDDVGAILAVSSDRQRVAVFTGLDYEALRSIVVRIIPVRGDGAEQLDLPPFDLEGTEVWSMGAWLP
jgi:hypothetical protein